MVNFQEYYQSFKNLMNALIKFNWIKAVFKFCLDNKIKLIYSATSASLGNKGMIKIFLLMHLQNQKI